MEIDIEEEFPTTKSQIYFNSAAVSICPKSTLESIISYNEDRCRTLLDEGPIAMIEGEDRWTKKVDESKGLFAKVIGAEEEEIAFIPNATTGVNTVLSMLPVKRGDNLVTTDISYPMGAIVCLKRRERGAETRFVKNLNGEVKTEDFEKVVDDNTVAIVVDQAGWHNGFLHDLKALAEIAHDHSAYLVVDGIQSIGGMEMDVKEEGVDFMATSTYKWLLGGPYTQSAGYLYVRKELIDAFQPLFVGNQSIDQSQLSRNVFGEFDLYELNYGEGIERFQIYPKYETAYVAVENSMRILLKEGLANVERRIKRLGTLLVEGLLDSGFELQTPIEEEKRLYLNVKMRDNREVEKKLAERNIVVSARVGGLRIAPHFYNREDEVETFLETLKEVVRQAS